MDRVRWKEVNEIFHAALEIPPCDRPQFIAAAVAGDADLKAEVELLLDADSKAGSFIEVPLLPDGLLDGPTLKLRPGEILCERFKIVRTLGEGGMGQVYEAVDNELGVSVALKLIRAEISSDPDVMARFRQEVRLARRITHPNVCRTFDLERDTRFLDSAHGSTRDLIFLTMEFLEGETLAERIRREGALPIEEVLTVARQVAEALDAARHLGVVHRDLKPSNIMLVPTGPDSLSTCRAVLTDFGLARVAPMISSVSPSDLSRSARPIGTLAYMAPEQLRSDPVSPATDIYAFGLVLFEMVTGQRAFPSDSFLSGIAQRLSGPVPDPRTMAPLLSEPWCEAIAGCLQRDAGDRFATATQVIQVIERGSNKRKEPSRWMPASRPSARVLIMFAMGLSLGVSLSVIGIRLLMQREGTVRPGTVVFLAPVQNRTGDRNLDNLTELLRASLAQSSQINLLSQSHIGDTLQQMTKTPDTPITEPIAREIAMRNGAIRVIIASVTASGNLYNLRIDIQQPSNAPSGYRNHWPKSFSWYNSTANSSTVSSELSTCIRNAADWIRSEAGESKSDIAFLDTPPEAVTTNSWQALSEFNLAQQHDLIMMKDAAITELHEAITLDPDFALAYAKLGGILVSMGRYAEGYAAYNMALQKDAGHRLSRRERDLIAGDYASDTGDFQSAVASYRDAAAFYPNHVEVWTSQVYPLDLLDRPREALTALAQAESLSPGTHPGAGGMAYTEMQIGNYAEARRWIATIRESGRADYSTLLEGYDDFLMGDLPSAQLAFEHLQKSSDPHFRRDGFAAAARLEAEEGRFEQALGLLSQPNRVNSKDDFGADEARRLLDIAYLFGKVEHYDKMLDTINEVLKPGLSPDTVVLASNSVGRFLPYMPRTARQRGVSLLRTMQQLVDPTQLSPVFSIARWRVRGELELASGNASSAVRSFQRADVLDAELAPRDYLARALLAQAVSIRKNGAADSLKREVLSKLAYVALRPVTVWRRPMDFPPGSVADAMQDYNDIAQHMSEVPPEARMVRSALQRLRPSTEAN